VKDLKNNFTAKVNFIETKAKSALGFLGGKKDDKVPRNQVEIKIVKTHNNVEVPLMIGSGNYLRYVQFEGQYTWKYTDKVTEFVSESRATALPSSSVFRREIDLIVEKKYAEADKIVEGVEAEELKDEKNRNKFSKEMYKYQ